MNDISKILTNLILIDDMLISFGLTFIASYILLWKNIVSYKLTKELGNMLVLFFSLFMVIWFIIISYRWFIHNSEFSKSFNYLLITITLIILSVFVSIIDYINYLVYPNSYSINEVAFKYKIISSKEKKIAFEKKLKQDIEELEEIVSQDKLTFKFEKFSDFISRILTGKEYIETPPSKIIPGDYYYNIVETKSILNIYLRNSRDPKSDRVLFWEFEYYINTPTNSYKIDEILFNDVTDFNPSKINVSSQQIKHCINIEYKKLKRELSFENKIDEKDRVLSFFDILYSNVCILMSVSPNSLIPVNFSSKLIRVILGIIKFIILGILIIMFTK